MALINSNKGIVKNDINFFAAFTASARKQAQALAAVAVVALVAVGITLVILGYQAYKWYSLKSSVDGLKAELQKPEYAELDARARDLQNEMVSKTQYFYTLSQMRMAVDKTPSASVALCDVIGENIPNDAYVSVYTLSGTDAQISGYAYSYYSALEMVNRIQNRDVFNSPDIEITRVTPPTGNEDYVEGIPYVDSCYMFTVSGTLTADVYVSFSSYLDDGVSITALSGVQTQALKPGSEYRYEYIANYEGYELSRIKVDGVELPAETVQSFKDSDAIWGVAQSSISIECYYKVVAESAQGGEA